VVTAPVPGTIRSIFVSQREKVARGQVLVEVEVLGMVQKIAAPVDGVVRLLLVNVGEQVRENTLLVEIDS
jgi:biotin carboxyl carrier protein